MKDTKFMREVNERDGLIVEYAVEYYGRDYGQDDPFLYKERLEVKINKIELDLLAILGRAIKYMKKDTLNILDEA